jgi:hypothetical protein
MAQKPDLETLKALNGNITDEFRANAGKVGGRNGKLLIVAGYAGADVIVRRRRARARPVRT